MDYNSYPAYARRTAKALEPKQAFEHAVLGIATDMGEVGSIIKANVIYNKPIDRKHLVKELGDVCWFISYACDCLGITLSDIVYFPIEDREFMASQHLDEKSNYWIKRGLQIAGKLCSHNLEVPIPIREDYTFKMYLAKAFVCVSVIAFLNGIEMEEVYVENIDKLRQRYPAGYTDIDAIQRKDASV